MGEYESGGRVVRARVLQEITGSSAYDGRCCRNPVPLSSIDREKFHLAARVSNLAGLLCFFQSVSTPLTIDVESYAGEEYEEKNDESTSDGHENSVECGAMLMMYGRWWGYNWGWKDS